MIMANLVLVIHFCLVFFIVSGFIFFPLGYIAKWTWVRNFRLRLLHLVFMLIVTIEAVLGITCPLTYIENLLRNSYEGHSFVGYWISNIIYWDFPAQFFIGLYTFCLAWTLAMWWLFPPHKN